MEMEVLRSALGTKGAASTFSSSAKDREPRERCFQMLLSVFNCGRKGKRRVHGVGSSGYLRDVNIVLISSSSRARVDVLLAGESKEEEEMEGRRGGVRYPLNSP